MFLSRSEKSEIKGENECIKESRRLDSQLLTEAVKSSVGVRNKRGQEGNERTSEAERLDPRSHQ